MKKKQTKIAFSVIFTSLFVLSGIISCITIPLKNEFMNIKSSGKKDKISRVGWIEEYDKKPKGERFSLFELYGGFWADAEKIPGDDGYHDPFPHNDGEDDDLLCWAATASNMLKWAGWGFVDGIEALKYGNTDEIFQYYKDHIRDEGASVNFGLRWWFNGIAGSIEKVNHFGFYNPPEYDPSDYITSIDFGVTAFKIRDSLNLGQTVGLGIYKIKGNGAHAITCWGYNYVGDKIVGLWCTDSDDDKSSSNAPNVLKYYEIKYDRRKDYWFFPKYGSKPQKWKIGNICALKVFPGRVRPEAEIKIDYMGSGQYIFDASDSFNPHGDDFYYRWDYNGDSIWDTDWSNHPKVTHLYDTNAPSFVKVYLQVFDGRLRDIDTRRIATRPIIVAPISPIAPILPIHTGFTSISL